MRMHGLRQLLPSVPRPSALAKEQCDADDAAELKECLKAMRAPNARPLVPPAARPAAEIPVTEAPDKTAALPPEPAVATSDRPATLAAPDEAALCQRYFPNIGQTMQVPCSK